MSLITLDELRAIRTTYKDLADDLRPEHASGQCVHREYSFVEAAKSDIYKIKTLDDAEIVSIFNKIISPTLKEMTEVDLFSLVTVALNIRHPVSHTIMLAPPWTADTLCSTFATAAPVSSSKVSMTRDSAAAVVLTVIPAADHMETDKISDESLKVQATAICFLFAWLTRFSVKTPSVALALQYKKLKETFMKFYQKSSTIFDSFNPDKTWVECLRNSFDSFVRVKNTLVIYVAAAETANKGDLAAFNLLRYLYFQNLEFMGMHAYVSIVSIMSKIALPPSLILTWLRMSGAELAIDEAHKIMSTLDNGMIPNGAQAERLWKYARMLDAGYFNRLQTTYAAELMATLAYIEIKLGISSETGYSSPLNIFAIANNKHIRDIGKAKAEAFMDCKNNTISLSRDASVVDKIYARKLGIQPHERQPQEEAPEESAKRRQEEETVAEPVTKRKKPPPAGGIPPPPFVIN